MNPIKVTMLSFGLAVLALGAPAAAAGIEPTVHPLPPASAYACHLGEPTDSVICYVDDAAYGLAGHAAAICRATGNSDPTCSGHGGHVQWAYTCAKSGVTPPAGWACEHGPCWHVTEDTCFQLQLEYSCSEEAWLCRTAFPVRINRLPAPAAAAAAAPGSSLFDNPPVAYDCHTGDPSGSAWCFVNDGAYGAVGHFEAVCREVDAEPEACEGHGDYFLRSYQCATDAPATDWWDCDGGFPDCWKVHEWVCIGLALRPKGCHGDACLRLWLPLSQSTTGGLRFRALDCHLDNPVDTVLCFVNDAVYGAAAHGHAFCRTAADDDPVCHAYVDLTLWGYQCATWGVNSIPGKWYCYA